MPVAPIHLNLKVIQQLIESALDEDLGLGDITTDCIIIDDRIMEAVVTAKESLVLCGLDMFREVFKKLESTTSFSEQSFGDGDVVPQGETIVKLKAHCTNLLKGERVALNILQWLSGIATMTRQFVERARPLTVLDTRKTRAGLRVFEKYAVKCGGGSNHRFGLFDAVLIKDNHIKAAGSISTAVARAREKLGKSKTVEVETTSLDEVRESLNAGADIIMLDNMPLEMIHEAVRLVSHRARIEVSGSVTLDRLDELATTGIDYVSVGALTHSARAVDISMNFLPDECDLDCITGRKLLL